MAAAGRAVLWFRNDLRVRDNQLFHYAEVLGARELLALYCVDPRHFAISPWGRHARTGVHRARFLSESLEDLAGSLKGFGCQLVVVVGKPEQVIPDLLSQGGVLAFQREDTSEEQEVEEALLQRLPGTVSACSHWTHTMLHRDDLGWDPQEFLPVPFGKYFHGTCSQVLPRQELPRLKKGRLPPPPGSTPKGREGVWRVIASSAGAIEAEMRAAAAECGGPDLEGEFRALARTVEVGEPAIEWRGGEAAGLARLDEYATVAGLGTYHRTRNQLHGRNHSSHLSPWIANGCLSPRTIYWKAKEYERLHGHVEKDKRFDHVQKFVFELCWRDYFRFYCAHSGRRVFYLGGPAKRIRAWSRDVDAEARWKEGRTGVPLVDALMRELRYTGFISNRGRYIVACYLVHYMGIDWRVGADWFEHLLLDHDVCSNYGEWTSMANVAAVRGARTPLGLKGRGPTGGRRPGARGDGGDPWAKGAETGDAIFDPWEQAAQYDRREEYVRRWVPELRNVPAGFAHRPSELDTAQRKAAGCHAYPMRPLAEEMLSRTDRRVSGGTSFGAAVADGSGSRSSTAAAATPARRVFLTEDPAEEDGQAVAGSSRFRRGARAAARGQPGQRHEAAEGRGATHGCLATGGAGNSGSGRRVILTPGPDAAQQVGHYAPKGGVGGYPEAAPDSLRGGGARRWRPKRGYHEGTVSETAAGG